MLAVHILIVFPEPSNTGYTEHVDPVTRLLVSLIYEHSKIQNERGSNGSQRTRQALLSIPRQETEGQTNDVGSGFRDVDSRQDESVV